MLVELSDAQVAHVAREAAARANPAELLPEISDVDQLRDVLVPLLDDAAYSRSVLRALLVLDAHPLDGSGRTLTGVSTQLGLSPSTTHRYLNTWVAVGMLEQDPRSRRYRRVLAGRTGGERGFTSRGGGDAG